MNAGRPPSQAGLLGVAAALIAASALGAPAAGQYPYPGDPFDERYHQGPPGAGPPAGVGVRDLTVQLARESRRLLDDVSAELAGTSLGYRASAQASSLAQAFDRCDELAARGPSAGPALQAAIGQAAPALGALQATLGAAGGVAPSSTRTIDRVGRLFEDLKRVAGVGVGLPPPGGVGPEAARVAARRLADDVTRTQLQLQSSGLANYSPYNRVARDLVGLGSAMQGIVDLIDRQAPPQAVSAELARARGTVDRVDAVLSADPNLPPGVGPSWGAVRRDLPALAALLGPGPGVLPPVIVPPAVVRPPVTPTLPPAYGGPLAILDEWLGAVDRLVAVQQPVVARVPQGFQILADARELRGSLARLRQQVGSGVPPAGFAGAFRKAERDYAQLRGRIDRIAGLRSGPNIDLVRSMQAPLEQFRAYAYPQ